MPLKHSYQNGPLAIVMALNLLACCLVFCSLLVCCIGCGCGNQPNVSAPATTGAKTDAVTDSQTVTLFDGTLKNWSVTNFGGEAEVELAGKEIILPAGYPMTGINWTGQSLPTQNYEISLEAKKTEGNDFFCGLTFPVGASHCSLILGGWGGNLVGLSCIDGDDASNNGTKQFHQFETEKWYRIVVFVDENGIEVKLDDEVIINQARLGHTFTVRNETRACRPLGICNFQTSSVIRNIVLKTGDQKQ